MSVFIPGNSSTTYGLTWGEAVNGSLDFFGDTDWWRISLFSGYGYQVWLGGFDAGRGTLRDPYLGIYNGSSHGVTGNNDFNYPLDQGSYIYFAPVTTGTFYLSAEEYGNNATGSYRLAVSRDELSSTSSAAAVAVNGSITGSIGYYGDQSDWFRVTLQAGTTYVFDLSGSDGDGALGDLTLDDPHLFLRSATGIAITDDDDAGLGLNSRIVYTPTASGTYFLDSQESGLNAAGTYRLLVNANPDAGAIAIGTSANGVIEFTGDVDYYSVVLSAGQNYVFSLSGGSLVDPFLELTDANGATIGWDDDSGPSLDAEIQFRPLVSGTYYLIARDSGHNSTGSYALGAYLKPEISISNAYGVEGSHGTSTSVFTLTLSAPSANVVTVFASTSGTSTATVDVDYLATFGTVTFAPGQTSATIAVPVIADNRFEPTETFNLLLSSPVGADLLTDSARGFIADDDNPYSQLPTDDLLELQWYLYDDTGINVFRVWPDYDGSGVTVAVFDQGIDPFHPDLDGNLVHEAGRKAIGLTPGGSPILQEDNHGTLVAGTIAAERNGSGIVGAAYGASLVSIYDPLLLATMPAAIPNAYQYAQNFDILNDSWGFANGFATGATWAFYDDFASPRFAPSGRALESLARDGRGGLGTIVVQSAGNSLSLGDDTNLHNFQNSQFVITVAATDYSGNATSYSSPGASVLVAAPGGGGTDVLSRVITTDRSGSLGQSGGDYDDTAGTSFSAPLVSGVVALMLEANPALGYRDVQEILAYSARELASTVNDWEYNGAENWNGGGLHFDSLNHNLGFGLVDAHAAVRLAETWDEHARTHANREQVSASSSPRLLIPDDSGIGAFDSLWIAQDIEVERVEVTLQVSHSWVGDLSVLLMSPELTTSFLVWRPEQGALEGYGSSLDDIDFTFTTVLPWGESSVGLWGLSVFDNESGDTGTFDAWTLNLIGKPTSADDTYIYTNEFAASVAKDPSRSTLNDVEGVDTLNAAAFLANLNLNLESGAISSMGGQSLVIGASTVIEHAIGGDGDDRISGNASANRIEGMRGADSLYGGSGNDSLLGGDGDDLMFGGAGDDTFDWDANRRGGRDTMQGGEGDDAYVLDANDIAVEFPGQGNDTAWVDRDRSLADMPNVENLHLYGEVAVRASGNDEANGLRGNDLANVLIGGAGSDTLDGGAGRDTLIGGLGNDVFIVDDLGDTFVELPGEGTDLVRAGVDHTLTANVENLTLTGTLPVSGTGNEQANVLVGNTAANQLDGRAGADSMNGGGGDDIYVVDVAGDVVVEAPGGGHDRVDSHTSYTLGAELESLRLLGTAPLQGTGNSLGNTLFSGPGDNRLDGVAGNDTVSYLFAGSRVTVNLTLAGAQPTGGSGTDTLVSIENLTGSAFADTLTGDSTANALDGGPGADRMEGGAGNDTYVVDNAGDLTIETGTSASEIDTVRSSVTRTLGANLENLTLIGTEAINGSGNALANVLTGNGAANNLFGAAGNDTLISGSGADTLNGGLGADRLEGGFGGDVYIVDDPLDVVVELGGQGTDRVSVGFSYTLGANVENLTLSGSASIDGTGNELPNLLQGNAGGNRLMGLAGSDTLTGGAGNDTLNGGTGADYMVGQEGDDTYYIDSSGDQTIESYPTFGIDHAITSVNRTISTNVENLTLVGAAVLGSGNGLANVLTGNELADTLNGVAGDDTLIGNAGNDTLNGGLGADRMEGGAGDDVYAVDSANDVVVELAGEGTDRVSSTVSWVLGNEVENLTLAGTAAINGTGNALPNVITGTPVANVIDGGAGNDTLSGFDGNDTLTGGAGNDRLSGGNGADRYRFVTTGDGTDTITDFASGSDKIAIVAANFGLVDGSTANLVVNGNPSSGAAAFLYASATGSLSFDADGNGPGAAVTLALLQNKPALISPADIALGP